MYFLLCSVSCRGVVVSMPVLQAGDPQFESQWQHTFTALRITLTLTGSVETVLMFLTKYHFHLFCDVEKKGCVHQRQLNHVKW